ncbi:uncharacterized protein EDB91DRAFT_1352885 [Suillus paluster]|uniref:uncharacterized protein n=1 Tax=Suillus paluster TaxID=48578 RepID=UPI001B88620B|nr:uncharacterized protein EDB91DRAFT_1352885 [Suillus paluster]KAG1717623.1 hypothetical protein EDB91DRAFT_1352885 [Suillus paluster]
MYGFQGQQTQRRPSGAPAPDSQQPALVGAGEAYPQYNIPQVAGKVLYQPPQHDPYFSGNVPRFEMSGNGQHGDHNTSGAFAGGPIHPRILLSVHTRDPSSPCEDSGSEASSRAPSVVPGSEEYQAMMLYSMGRQPATHLPHMNQNVNRRNGALEQSPNLNETVAYLVTEVKRLTEHAQHTDKELVLQKND